MASTVDDIQVVLRLRNHLHQSHVHFRGTVKVQQEARQQSPSRTRIVRTKERKKRLAQL